MARGRLVGGRIAHLTVGGTEHFQQAALTKWIFDLGSQTANLIQHIERPRVAIHRFHRQAIPAAGDTGVAVAAGDTGAAVATGSTGAKCRLEAVRQGCTTSKHRGEWAASGTRVHGAMAMISKFTERVFGKYASGNQQHGASAE